MTNYYTYVHCKPNGDPFYIGMGSGKRAWVMGRGRNKFHLHIINKYGKKNILVYTFECKNRESAIFDEIHNIKFLKSRGYKLANMTEGGEGAIGIKMSEEGKQKISKANKGNKYCLGYKHTESARKVMSEKAKEKPKLYFLGKKFTDEHKKKLSLAKLGKKYGSRGPYKKNELKIKRKLTDEHKKKLSLAKAGKKLTQEHIQNISRAKLAKKDIYNLLLVR